MTSPFANMPSIPAAPTQIVGGGLQDYLPLILQALQASQARKQRKAEESLQSLPEGTTYGQLSADQQKQYRRATGVKDLAADAVVRPLPSSDPGQTLRRSMAAAGIDPGSALGISMLHGQAAQAATGSPHALTTPTGMAAEVQTGEANAQAGLAVAGARRTQATDYQRAVNKVSNLPAGQNIEEAKLTPGELTSYQTFSNFVPSQPIADQLGGQAKGAVMKSALELAAHPDSASWASLFPGIKPADIIGAWALGIGSSLDIGLNRKAQLEVTTAQEGIKALMDAAQQVLKDTKLPFSPVFIGRVMEGDPAALKTPAGQLAWQTMNKGWEAALVQQSEKGNPRMLAIRQLMDLARIPQIASNPDLLGKYSNLVQENLASAMNETFGIEDNPANHREMMKRTAGVFDYNWFRNFVPGKDAMQITPAGQPNPQEQRQQADSALVAQAVQAAIGAINQPAVTPDSATPFGPPKKKPGLFQVKP